MVDVMNVVRRKGPVGEKVKEWSLAAEQKQNRPALPVRK
jgi:hypothetical protein